MDLKQQRAAALKAAQDIIGKAKADGRAMTDDERATVETKTTEIEGFDAQIKAAQDSDALMARLAGMGGGDEAERSEGNLKANSLGEHFAKSVGEAGLARLKTVRGATVSTDEFDGAKLATDTQVTTGTGLSPFLTEIDRTIVRPFRPGPTVADLLGVGTLGANSNAVTYFLEGAVEGAFATVAEAGQKPQLHYADPTSRTDAVRKIAGWWDTSDEMIEDLAFMVSEINQRGLYLLAMAEEAQLLNGNGTGTNVLGLMNRSGVQTEARGTAASGDTAPEAVFRGMTKVQTATGLSADGVMIHPLDYQTIRLSKDANGQYYGGGFFTGQYGVGGVPEQPPLWGLRTVVTTAVAQGTAVVGAFKQATTLYRKGGVRVESTNSDQGKFTMDIITTRIEERVALAARNPSAIVKVTLTPAAATV